MSLERDIDLIAAALAGKMPETTCGHNARGAIAAWGEEILCMACYADRQYQQRLVIHARLGEGDVPQGIVSPFRTPSRGDYVLGENMQACAAAWPRVRVLVRWNCGRQVVTMGDLESTLASHPADDHVRDVSVL